MSLQLKFRYIFVISESSFWDDILHNILLYVAATLLSVHLHESPVQRQSTVAAKIYLRPGPDKEDIPQTDF